MELYILYLGYCIIRLRATIQNTSLQSTSLILEQTGTPLNLFLHSRIRLTKCFLDIVGTYLERIVNVQESVGYKRIDDLKTSTCFFAQRGSFRPSGNIRGSYIDQDVVGLNSKLQNLSTDAPFGQNCRVTKSHQQKRHTKL